MAGLAACAADTPEAIAEPTPEVSPVPTPEPEPECRVFRAAFITQSLTNESQAETWSEFQRMAPEVDFEMSIFAGEYEPDVEFDGVLTAIANGYDVIFVNPSSIEDIAPALQQARDAGLIVGMLSSMIPDEYRHVVDFFVGFDNFLIGAQAGEFISQSFPDGASFVEVGGPVWDSVANARHEGFRSGIADNIIELGSVFAPTDWNTHEAMSIMEDFIARFGNQIDIVWCHWDEGVSGVIEALANAGIEDVFVAGVGGSSIGYQQVLDGVQALSVDLPTISLAWGSLRLARNMLEGETVLVDNWLPADMVTIDVARFSFLCPNW